MQAELQQEPGEFGFKNGVCLEFLKGACDKGGQCPFSHSLQEYYHHVCKRKPTGSISKKSIPATLQASLFGRGYLSAEDRCKRSYALRCVIPTLFPGDMRRSEAIIAALVRLAASMNLWIHQCLKF